MAVGSLKDCACSCLFLYHDLSLSTLAFTQKVCFSPLYCLGISHLFPASLCVYHSSKYQSLTLSTISLGSSEYVLFLYEVAFDSSIR
jgi:hypothetical protein